MRWIPGSEVRIEYAGFGKHRKCYYDAMLRLKTSISVIVLALTVLVGGSQAATFPSEVKECVTFVFVSGPQASAVPNGTAFLVGVPDTQKKDRVFGYLVTARHVLITPGGQYFPEIFVRLNKRAGGSELIRLPLSGPDALRVYTHPDPSIDIAVLPFLPSPEKFQVKVIPSSMITTRDVFQKQRIQEGDEVFFSGMFLQFIGATKNYPVVRFGRVAMITEEKIPFQGKMMDLYLLETQSFGGNSGSPVFFNLDPSRDPAGGMVIGPRILLLAGVMMGSFLDAQEIKLIQRSPTPVSLSNAGIAAVVPAHYLNEILTSPELEALRRAVK